MYSHPKARQKILGIPWLIHHISVTASCPGRQMSFGSSRTRSSSASGTRPCGDGGFFQIASPTMGYSYYGIHIYIYIIYIYMGYN